MNKILKQLSLQEKFDVIFFYISEKDPKFLDNLPAMQCPFVLNQVVQYGNEFYIIENITMHGNVKAKKLLSTDLYWRSSYLISVVKDEVKVLFEKSNKLTIIPIQDINIPSKIIYEHIFYGFFNNGKKKKKTETVYSFDKDWTTKANVEVVSTKELEVYSFIIKTITDLENKTEEIEI